ncbi:MAG TPA: ferredoxin family protein [Solirubrobacterales bacterium]|nr:ferredoxin family protein [Solirubrobacterales bacterium]
MTYVITAACIGEKDRSCTEVCPVDCIHEAGEMLVIDPVECIDCAACESVCPVQAIAPYEGVPEDQKDFIGINSAWADGRDAVEQRLAAWRKRARPPRP